MFKNLSRSKRERELRKAILITRIELRREQLAMASESIKTRVFTKIKDAKNNFAVPAVASLLIPAAICLASRGKVKPAQAAKYGVLAFQIVNNALPLIPSAQKRYPH